MSTSRFETPKAAPPANPTERNFWIAGLMWLVAVVGILAIFAIAAN